MRREGSYRALSSRLVATCLCCALALLLVASADVHAAGLTDSGPRVDIELPHDLPMSPDGWVKPPVIAQLTALGPGVVWYRIGAGPGPWERSYGFVVMPAGKQVLSAMLVSASGVPGPITQVVTRSDIHAEPYAASSSGITSLPAGATGGQIGGTVSVTVLVGRQLGAIVRRVGVNSQAGTGAAISALAFGAGKTVILVSAQTWAGALAASGLGGCYGAPVLLVGVKDVPSATRIEIRRLGARRAILCASKRSVRDKVVRTLRRMGLTVERLSGTTRYTVASAISKRIARMTKAAPASRVFVVRADRPHDAMIVAPLAYATRSPVLLTNPGSLPAVTARRLSASHFAVAVVVGDAISSRVVRAIAARAGSVERWPGSSPEDESVQIAAHEVLAGSASWAYVGIARADLCCEALCGSVLAGRNHGVLLLISAGNLDPGVAGALAAHAAEIKHCEIYGGEADVSAGVMAEIERILH